MVTDEMVEKACLAYWGEKNMTSMFARKTREGVMQSMRTALEAALSTDAEPVAYYKISRNGLWDFIEAHEFNGEADFKPLYAEPVKTAPAVAVKGRAAFPGVEGFGATFNRDKDAWELYTTPTCNRFGQIDGFNTKAVDWILEVMRSSFLAQPRNEAMRRMPIGSKRALVDELTKARNDFKTSNFEIAERIIAAIESLSAQVQDVAEWQVVPAETVIEEATKGRQVLAYENGRYYNAWLEFEASEGGWLWYDDADSEPNPSHWIPLPASPASKQGDAE